MWPFSHVMEGAIVGADCNVGEHVFIERGAIVGDGVTIKNGVALWEGVSVADHVFIGPNAVFTNDARPRSPRLPDVRTRHEQRLWFLPTFIEEGATVGANATVVCGVRLGRFCMVGAGAVVTKDVDPFTLVCGVPARPCGKVDRRGARLIKRGRYWIDAETARRYKFEGQDLREVP